jgi:hypothetical protein
MLVITIAALTAAPAKESDFSILAAVHAEQVIEPVATCTFSRLLAYSPKQEELGSWPDALRLLDETSRACGEAEAKAELSARLKAHSPAASAYEVNRETDAGFAYSTVVGLRIAASKFKLSLSPGEITVPPVRSPSIPKR